MVNKIQKGKVISISLAHMMNDWYMNFIQTLLPFLVAAGLSVGKGAILISAFTITSSLLQPVFGYLVDQKNQRWLVYAGTLWMAVLLSMVGIVTNYYLAFMLVVFSGFGTAAFHPQASAMISSVSGAKKGFCQSVFGAAGNVGWSLTPLLVIPVIQTYGLQATPFFVMPGILVALLLWLTAPRNALLKKTEPAPLLPVLRQVWPELSKIVLVVACRSITYFGLIAFLPLYLQAQGVSISESGYFIFNMLFVGAIGGVIGGYLSDKIGRKTIISGSLVLSTPLFWLFLHTDGLGKYIFLDLAGAALLASFAVTVVLAQEIISKNAAMASGLTLGFGIGVGGLGVGVFGILSEYTGMGFIINVLIVFPCLAGILGLSLKNKACQKFSSAA